MLIKIAKSKFFNILSGFHPELKLRTGITDKTKVRAIASEFKTLIDDPNKITAQTSNGMRRMVSMFHAD